MFSRYFRSFRIGYCTRGRTIICDHFTIYIEISVIRVKYDPPTRQSATKRNSRAKFVVFVSNTRYQHISDP